MHALPQGRPQQKFRPAWISMLFAIVAFGVTYWLWDRGRAGDHWASLATFITGGFAIVQLYRAVIDFDRERAHRRKLEDHEAKAREQGDSRWATWRDIERNPNFSEVDGMLLGTIVDERGRSRDVRLKERRNVMVTAPAGAGKTTGVTLPAIISLSESRKAESFFCFDPAAEVLAVALPWLIRHHYKVLLMSPFIDLVNQITAESRRIAGVDEFEDVGIDVFSSISFSMPERMIRSELRSIAKRVIPDIRGMDQETRFFYNSARKFFCYFAWREISRGVKPSLPTIAKEFLQGPHYLKDVFYQDENDDAFDGLLAEMAASYGGVLGTAGEQFAGGYEDAEHHLQDFQRRGALGEHVSKSQLDLRRLKNRGEKIALFCIYPLEHLQSHAPQVSMTITHIADALAADRRKGKCTMFIQEAGAIPLLSLAQNLNLYRKTGQRYFMDLQDILGQTEAHYGTAIRHQIIAGTQIHIGLSGMVEMESLKMFSDLCGTRGIVSSQLSDRALMGDRLPDFSPSMGHVSVPLARPEDIRLMGPGKMLMIAEHLHPAQLDTLRYWERKRWRDGTAPNPYHFED